MAKFRIWAQSITDCYIDIEAENEDIARKRAEEIDGGDFHTTVYGDWEWGSTERLLDTDQVDYLEEDFDE